jgi:hypothetical protein
MRSNSDCAMKCTPPVAFPTLVRGSSTDHIGGSLFTFGTRRNHPEPSAEPPSNQLPTAASQRLVPLFLVSRPRHRGGVDATINLNQSVDSSEDASCHARKMRPQPPISNGRRAKDNLNKTLTPPTNGTRASS